LATIAGRLNAAREAIRALSVATPDEPPALPPVELCTIFGAITDLDNAVRRADVLARDLRNPRRAQDFREQVATLHQTVCELLLQLAPHVKSETVRAALIELAEWSSDE
jgi:hypothetical protein